MEGAAFLSEADWFDGQDLQQYTRDHLLGRGSTGAVYLLRNDRTEDNDLVRAEPRGDGSASLHAPARRRAPGTPSHRAAPPPTPAHAA